MSEKATFSVNSQGEAERIPASETTEIKRILPVFRLGDGKLAGFEYDPAREVPIDIYVDPAGRAFDTKTGSLISEGNGKPGVPGSGYDEGRAH